MTSFVAPALDPAVKKLRGVRDLASLVTYLHEELEWPVAEFDFEDLVYDVTAQEAGLDPATEAKVRSIKRLRPLSNDQPWGIFFIDFVPGDLPITVLRRILRAVSIKKREQGRADRKAWQTDDLLFVSVLGEEGHRDLNLAHFNDDPAAKRATLRVVEWDAADTAFAILRTHNELQNLAWRREGETDDAWRERWNKAFALRPREVAQTAKALALQMATLAKLIRERVNDAIAVENEHGPLRELHNAFKEVLLHDLSEDGFADMYAQTLTYGLFAARNSRPAALTLDTAVEMIPNTNPFLRDLLAQFTTASGLTHSLDFDELGVDALIDALQNANMEAVVADFGRAKPGEDPVIHFYEDFLREYNKAQKIQRGVFYTPKPVVSFIVRSVHELLQTEFQLPDGLASSETWGDMVAKFPDLKIPEGAAASTSFVQILDPACGTGTFLVEVIDVIYRTMTEKWKREGRMALEFEGLWNEYVPKHLLTRIYGFELMVASYTIAHMKVGLKLGELGYKFAAAERLRIYLTNTLEPPHRIQPKFDIMRDPVAQEARGSNAVKEGVRFTVVVGNPPYSALSANLTPELRALVNPYRSVAGVRIVERNMLQFEKNIQDDYIKFFATAEAALNRSGVGILGYVSNHSFLDGPTLRGMRWRLLQSFNELRVMDVHGNALKSELPPDGVADKNVFEIRQGVAISLLASTASLGAPPVLEAFDLWGTRQQKYDFLSSRAWGRVSAENLMPEQPDFLFLATPYEPDEWRAAMPINSVLSKYSTGTETGFDALLMAFDPEELLAKVREFSDEARSPQEVRVAFGAATGHAAELLARRREFDIGNAARYVRDVQFRPFDLRSVYLKKDLLKTNSFGVMAGLGPGRPALVTTRQTKEHFGAFAIHGFAAHKCISGYDRSYIFPLLGADGVSHVAEAFRDVLQKARGAPLSSGEMFSHILAVLNAPSYAHRFHGLLKRNFPRVPILLEQSAIQGIVRLGAQLTETYALSARGHPEVVFEGARSTEVGVCSYSNGFVTIGAGRFGGVSEQVWTHRVGAYQPCQQWLKDRRGHVLTDEDIEHYKRIIGAITETIRIQKEIDEVIEAHGGWPAAFQGGEGE